MSNGTWTSTPCSCHMVPESLAVAFTCAIRPFESVSLDTGVSPVFSFPEIGVRESVHMHSDKTVKRKDEGKHIPDSHYSMLG